MVTVLALAGTACGGDDEADDTTTTTTEASTETTVQELTDDEFAAQVDPLLADIEAAGTDLCAVLEAASAQGPEAPAATEAQVESTIDAQVAILRAISGSEPVDEANAAILNKVADDLSAAAESAGYSVAFLQGEEFTQVLSGEEFTTAIGAYQTRQAAECETTEPAPAPGDAPPGAPGDTPTNAPG